MNYPFHRLDGGAPRRPAAGAATVITVFIAFLFIAAAPALPVSEGTSAAMPRSLLAGDRVTPGVSHSLLLAATPTDLFPGNAANNDARNIAAKVQATLLETEDIQQVLRMEVIDPRSGAATRAEGRLRAKLPHLFRLDFTKPDMLAGVAILVNLAENKAWQYQPVTEQLIVQPWDQLARERGMEFDVQNWLGIPDPELFHLRRGPDYRVDGTTYIVLEGRPRTPSSTAARYEFFVHPERWWVEGLRLYDSADNLTFSVFIDNVTLNEGLHESQLEAFPAGVEIIHR